ncbi:hypothetical protein [uncultured Microbulbifer sp.]|uniref:hypothetical protein n=1 Tax=uncultured Microbulbifer sp. TaxID=348147 RepID=UPI00261DD8F0|nr:hypothetical protein [uncultured Microbulbifer sp.]
MFKTVMAELGYMGYLDWKNIYNIEEFIFSLDEVLSKLSLKKNISGRKARDNHRNTEI